MSESSLSLVAPSAITGMSETSLSRVAPPAIAGIEDTYLDGEPMREEGQDETHNATQKGDL